MGGSRGRLADLLQEAVSFGAIAAPRGAAPGAQRKRAPRKPEEEAAIMRRTSAGGRVAHAINELAKKIRNSRKDDSLSELMEGWVDDLRKSHAHKVPASGEGGGTVMENATVAKYNGGYMTLGFTKELPYYGGDGRAWLVYHALGGPDIDAEGEDIQRRKKQLNDIQSATRGHHVTGKYRQSASQRHERLLEQLRRIVLEALALEARDPDLYKVAKIFKEIERKRANEAKAREPEVDATTQEEAREPDLGADSGAPQPKAATSAAQQAKQPAASKARARKPAASVSHEDWEPRRSGRVRTAKSAAAKEAESGTTVAGDRPRRIQKLGERPRR
jgi:hypothetical protein